MLRTPYAGTGSVWYTMRLVLVALGAGCLVYIFRWQWNHHPSHVLLGLASTTALQLLYFVAYVWFSTEPTRFLDVLLPPILVGPVYDLARDMYPSQGTFLSVVCCFIFICTDDMEPEFTGPGLVVSVFPLTAAAYINSVNRQRDV